jgi:hypothetical protein
MVAFDFAEALLKFAAPRLKAAGYEYRDALQDRSALYGFCKNLKGDIQALIFFQRHQYNESPVGYEFTVNLVRCQTKDLTHWERGRYEGFLNNRLPWVLWFIYELRIYPSSDHWWTCANESQVRDELVDAVDKIEWYGIPWLEDLNSRVPDIPDALIAQFREMLLKIVVPSLSELGYQEIQCKGKSRFCFGKQVLGDLCTFVAFELRGSPPRFANLTFDVLLLRRWSSQPWYSLSPDTWFGSLGLLLWKQYGLRKTPFRYYDWDYSSSLSERES